MNGLPIQHFTLNQKQFQNGGGFAPAPGTPAYKSFQKDLFKTYNTYPEARLRGSETMYGKYNGKAVVGNENPTQLQQILNNVEYFKNNTPESNVYRPENSHYSTIPSLQPIPNDLPAYGKIGGKKMQNGGSFLKQYQLAGTVNIPDKSTSMDWKNTSDIHGNTQPNIASTDKEADISFGQAFKNARHDGDKQFEWHNKKFNTYLAETPSSNTDLSFGQAYKNARKEGDSTFEWHNKKFNSDLKKDSGQKSDNKNKYSQDAINYYNLNNEKNDENDLLKNYNNSNLYTADRNMEPYTNAVKLSHFATNFYNS